MNEKERMIGFWNREAKRLERLAMELSNAGAGRAALPLERVAARFRLKAAKARLES